MVLLLRSVRSLQQLYTMTMDVHARYRTDGTSGGGGVLVPRFNERFLLSLAQCHNCLVCDDELNVLPLSRTALRQLNRQQHQHNNNNNTNTNNTIQHDSETGEVLVHSANDPESQQLAQLKESLADTPHVGVLVELAKTLDQAKALLVFLEACSDKRSGPSDPTRRWWCGGGGVEDGGSDGGTRPWQIGGCGVVFRRVPCRWGIPQLPSRHPNRKTW